MKKSLKTIAMLLLGTCIVGCSNDDETLPTEPAAGAESAYLSVTITSSGATTRSGESFIYGTAAEQAVGSARFFFYDSYGNYVCEATVWNGGKAVTDDPVANIEYKGNSVLVLTGVTSVNYPTDMVTVLNAPTGFTAPTTLTALETTLTNCGWNNGNTENNFIMSTSSYDQGEGKSYFTTKLAAADFQTTAKLATADQNPVNVYVERLAAKVVMSVDESQLKPVAGEDNLYELFPSTVAGFDTPQTLYVRFLGWGLNATTPDSYLMKNIDRTQTIANFTWSQPDYFRSYWAHSYNYGKSVYYPTEYKPDDAAYALNYYTPSELQAANGFTAATNYAYCNENTNTPEILAANHPDAITSAVVIAQVEYKNADGELTTLDMVRYNGVLFTKDQYIAYVLNSLQAAGSLSYKHVSTGATITTTDVKLANAYNGRVVVQLASTDEDWQTNSETPETVTVETINNTLKGFNATNKAIAYTNGLMYYNIPIEHINTTADAKDVDGNLTIAEGHYGVVRNHCYQITINAIEHLGKGIFSPEKPVNPNPGVDPDPEPDPEDPIIPNDDEEEYYHLGATVNILSWLSVSQTVAL